jgi:hypothetical protein
MMIKFIFLLSFSYFLRLLLIRWGNLMENAGEEEKLDKNSWHFVDHLMNALRVF